ncbi:universal stress protein [Bradyrhizobium sediminis]|uniref:Universal stress protein n=1 Tax=Bradyrhizobium sediminis TaxID=2840469 RepID=A0A975RTP2_9BRAD|nr:universal stress protein [Bradyrhizobium sediminis]QWG20232.1 universal stress protein [Bradyrhizobium sediminis]
MSYATLMVCVNVDHVSKTLVGVAAGLTDKFSAKLIGLSALAITPPFVAEGVVIVDNASESDVAQVKARLAEAEDKFRAAAGAGREVEWRSALEIPTDALISEARCADLILLEKSSRSIDLYRVADSGAAILGAGRPFLVVPGSVKSLTADHVVVGWKDTREARRAIQDALPFLHEAKRVTVVEICQNDQKEAARHHVDDVVLYLARHRIRAEGRVEMQLPGSSADQIIRFAEDEGADLLVTGAYGHSRLNEWIFGGVTHDLLASTPICCLMSH